MKKTKSIFLTFLLIMSLSQMALAVDHKAGGNLAFYAVTDSLYKDVYGTGNLMFGAFLSFEFMKRLELRAEANYYKDAGEMTVSKEEIKFTLIPLVAGIRFKLINSKISPYLGAGIDFCYYKEALPERIEDVSESKLGFHGELGTYLKVTHNLFLDLNIRYLKLDVKPLNETVKLGGIRAGVGFGIAF